MRFMTQGARGYGVCWHQGRWSGRSARFSTGSSVAGLSDRQLLDRFAAQRDATGEAAFAALVARHGPMVLGVCTAASGRSTPR